MLLPMNPLSVSGNRSGIVRKYSDMRFIAADCFIIDFQKEELLSAVLWNGMQTGVMTVYASFCLIDKAEKIFEK